MSNGHRGFRDERGNLIGHVFNVLDAIVQDVHLPPAVEFPLDGTLDPSFLIRDHLGDHRTAFDRRRGQSADVTEFHH